MLPQNGREKSEEVIMNMEYYKVFYETAQAGSVSAAARTLCITQPAVSQAIKNLEKELGGDLFVRTSKGLKLTKEGNVLYSYIKQGYELIKLGEEKYKNMLNLDSGEIVIGASDMSLQFYLLPYLEKYHELYPNIKISVTNAPTPETLKNLKEGKIDFGIVSTPFDTDKDIRCMKVRKIKTIFIGGSEYEKYKGKKLSIDTVMEMPLICLEQKTSTRRAADIFFERYGLKPEPEFELATSDIIVQFVLRNLGIGIVVEDFAKPYIERGEVFRLEFQEAIDERDMTVVVSEKNYLSTAGNTLLEMLRLR